MNSPASMTGGTDAATTVRTALHDILAGEMLNETRMQAVVEAFMSGDCPDALIAGVLVALRQRGETAAEITGAARALRSHATPLVIDLAHLVDTCGTGGDGHHTFNISTTCAFVAAAAGARVAKHGNRSVSSSSGSADVLERLGARIDLEAASVRDAITELGVGFLFAPTFHQAMRHVGPIRKTLGTRTLFNVLGPLSNPAQPPSQVIGVFSAAWVQRLATVSAALGARHVMVVSGEDGSDEFSLAGPTHVAELKDGEIREYQVSPTDFGLAPAPLSAIGVGSPDESAEVIRQVLAGATGPCRDVVLLNAGAAIHTAGITDSHLAGIAVARDVIDSGAARTRLADYIDFTQSVA